ncbi:hypothetical protein G6F62_014037 [Rhizopus arrhizus]|nr:hypothetical protein G6F62_014037 [Rhizopus arrhizus]
MTAVPLVTQTAATPMRSGRYTAGNAYPQTGSGVGSAPIGSGLPLPTPVNLPEGTPAEQAASMDAASFFALFFDVLRNNPPHANDSPILDRMRRIGLDSRQPFSRWRVAASPMACRAWARRSTAGRPSWRASAPTAPTTRAAPPSLMRAWARRRRKTCCTR